MPSSPADLSVTQLHCFLAVARCGSFAEAGRRLGLSSSALSKTITRLEAGRGIKLFHRSTHAVSLTAEGGALLGPASEVVQSLSAAAAALDELSTAGASGRVRISAPVGLMRRRVAPLLTRFSAAFPEIELDLRASNERVDLAAEGIDIAIRGGALDGLNGHLAQVWFHYPWVACASRGYLERCGAPASPEDLASHAVLGFRNLHTGAIRPWRLWPRDGGEPLVLTPRARFVLDDGESTWIAALEGAGIVVAPLWLAAEGLESGEMVPVLRGWRGEQTSVSLLRRDRHPGSRRVDAVIDFLREHTPRFSPELLEAVAWAC